MFKSEYLDMSQLIKSEQIVKLFKAVEEHGGAIRFVGGAVRDTMAGLKTSDIDLATNLSPEELVEACQDYGIKTIPLGIRFAAVGVVIGKETLEVASLKRTIKTEEKREVIEFTDDWSADASTRDLTINAVYADLNGNVFDYYNGISDLENGIIRFIGRPEDRIKENYLRIMRFFRFYSIFGKKPIDKASLAACIKLKKGLRSVAIEQVRDELFKLLVTPNVTPTIKIIFDNDILSYFLPKAKNLEALERLTHIVANEKYEGSFLRRLFVIYQPNSVEATNIANTLRLSKKQKETFTKWAQIELSPENMSSPQRRKVFVYRYGKQFCIDKILLTSAIYNAGTKTLHDVLTEIEQMEVPTFPLRGRDILALEKMESKDIGRTLATLEQRWLDSDFRLTKEELLNIVRKTS